MPKSITFRCPDDLVELIEARVAATSKDKTTVILEMLRSGFSSVSNGEPNTLPEVSTVNSVRHDTDLSNLIDERVEAKINAQLDEIRSQLEELRGKLPAR